LGVVVELGVDVDADAVADMMASIAQVAPNASSVADIKGRVKMARILEVRIVLTM